MSDFKAKMQFDFDSAPPDPLAVFKGVYFWGKGGKWEGGRGGGSEGDGGRGEGREGKGKKRGEGREGEGVKEGKERTPTAFWTNRTMVIGLVSLWCLAVWLSATENGLLRCLIGPNNFTFSALRGMPARTNDEKGVCPSVCLSVCQTPASWQNGRKMCPSKS